MNTIEVKKLSKNFGKTQTLKDVSFEVFKGEIFGFLGPNGAGKTTTIRCLMDFVRPSSGSVTLLGKDAQKDSVYLKNKIGYLSDTARFYDNWTAQNHLDFQESIRGASRNLQELLKTFGLNPKLKFAHLSSGNKRKLAIILSLMNAPEILILDEPTSALDPLLQDAFHSYIKDFARRGGTVFMSSHNLSEVEKICDRVGIIKNGSMISTEKISAMKLLKVYNVTFHIDISTKFDSSILKDPNIKILSQVNNNFVLKVKGDINSLINKLSQIKISDLEITHENLENIFMELYKND